MVADRERFKKLVGSIAIKEEEEEEKLLLGLKAFNPSLRKICRYCTLYK